MSEVQSAIKTLDVPVEKPPPPPQDSCDVYAMFDEIVPEHERHRDFSEIEEDDEHVLVKKSVKTRMTVVAEIIKSEHEYLEQMSFFYTRFVAPLEAALNSPKQRILTQTDTDAVVCNLSTIVYTFKRNIPSICL